MPNLVEPRAQRWIHAWSRKTGRNSGAWALLFLILDLIAITATVVIADQSCSDPGLLRNTACERDRAIGVAIAGLVSVVGLFLLIIAWCTWLSIRQHGKRTEKMVEEFAPRLRSAKDWFVGGAIDAATFARLRSHYEPLAQGEIPGASARLSGEILASSGAAVICFSPLLWLLSVAGIEGPRSFGFALVVPVLGIALGIALYVTGARMRSRGRAIGERAVAAAMVADEDLLRTATAARPRRVAVRTA